MCNCPIKCRFISNELSECELEDGDLVRVAAGAGITSSCSQVESIQLLRVQRQILIYTKKNRLLVQAVLSVGAIFFKKFVRIFRFAHIYGWKEKHKGDEADGQHGNAALG